MNGTSRIRLYLDGFMPFLPCALVASCLFGTFGCVAVPARMPTQTRDSSGKPLALDLTFLKSGSTTRDEVTKRLSAIDTGVNQNNLFWGRWDSSKWRTTAIGFVPPAGERVWRAHNLLIQFDQNGVVKSWVIAGDKELARQLDVYDPAATDCLLDLSSPLHAKAKSPVDVQDCCNKEPPPTADFVLTADSFQYNLYFARRSGPHLSTLETPRTNIRRMAVTPEAFYTGPFSGEVPYAEPNHLVATLYFSKPAVNHYGERGHFARKKLELAIDPPTFLLLRHYIRQTKLNPAPTSARPDDTKGSANDQRHSSAGNVAIEEVAISGRNCGYSSGSCRSERQEQQL